MKCAMTDSPAGAQVSPQKTPKSQPPKPCSLQSRFILMEGATVALALALMCIALAISSRLSSAGQGTQGFALYARILEIVLAALALFPVAVILWFSHAHRQHIWRPLEAL